MEDYTQHWLKIKKNREDITDYLIHWTGNISTLKRIVQCGYLKPTFAPRKSPFAGDSTRNTIRGSRPAVCLTEQPLGAFIRSCNALPGRYARYGIAVKKDRLYEYGGRPVIYGDESLLCSLPESLRYLWVRFQPYPDPNRGGYPIDWTHEREWRATVSEYSNPDWGNHISKGVPLLLPPDVETKELLLPWILVRTEPEATEMREWVGTLPEYSGNNGIVKKYRDILPSVPILPLDVAESKIREGHQTWARFDTLPYRELDPNSPLTKVGWNKISPSSTPTRQEP